MRIHDNGNLMQHGEAWWVAWQPYSAKQPKVAIAIVEGSRPYQTLNIEGHYPTEVWVLQRATPPPVYKYEDGSLRSVAECSFQKQQEVHVACE